MASSVEDASDASLKQVAFFSVRLLKHLSNVGVLDEQLLAKVSQISPRFRTFAINADERLVKQETDAWRAFLDVIRRPLATPRSAALPENINACQTRLRCRLPYWLRALYSVCDGQDASDTSPRHRKRKPPPVGVFCGFSPLKPLSHLQVETHMEQKVIFLTSFEDNEALVLCRSTQRVKQWTFCRETRSVVQQVPWFEGHSVRTICKRLELHWQLQCAVTADDADEILSLVKDHGADARWLEWKTEFNATLLHTCSLSEPKPDGRKGKPLAALALLACRADPSIKLRDSCWMTGMDAVACAMEFDGDSILESLLFRGYATLEEASLVLQAGPGESERLKALGALV
eukprot:TRINITY_DN9340_c1_g1_i4.p1 TRINITY_DN9340_c1_g1~~TRINITY_DN9340_c1_g1_i4.p1  ORF type:complete len:364 (+),score=42.93 TRINITY_DN9340_c1_g1_i4:56-1093(+)